MRITRIEQSTNPTSVIISFKLSYTLNPNLQIGTLPMTNTTWKHISFYEKYFLNFITYQSLILTLHRSTFINMLVTKPFSGMPIEVSNNISLNRIEMQQSCTKQVKQNSLVYSNLYALLVVKQHLNLNIPAL